MGFDQSASGLDGLQQLLHQLWVLGCIVCGVNEGGLTLMDLFQKHKLWLIKIIGSAK